MKKSKLLAVALIGLMLAGGLVLASCRAGCDGPGNCEVKDGKGTACSNFTIGEDGPTGGCAAVIKGIMGSGSAKCDC